jgi:hypothetical protein
MNEESLRRLFFEMNVFKKKKKKKEKKRKKGAWQNGAREFFRIEANTHQKNRAESCLCGPRQRKGEKGKKLKGQKKERRKSGA